MRAYVSIAVRDNICILFYITTIARVDTPHVFAYNVREFVHDWRAAHGDAAVWVE